MDNKEIHELIKLISKSNLAEFKVKQGDFELTIRTDNYSRGRTENVYPMYSQPMAQPAPVSAPAASAPAASSAPVVESTSEAAAPAAGSNLVAIKSPMVGTFYRSPSPDKAAFIQVGDHVKSGDVVCIIEAMKLFNEIESEVSGKVVKFMVDDATPVEYDQVLFLVDPAG